MKSYRAKWAEQPMQELTPLAIRNNNQGDQ